MQATVTGDAATAAPELTLAADLYALLVFLNKSCSSDLFAAMGQRDLSITQLKLLHQLELADHELTLKEAAERVLLSLPAASRTVDDLVRRGLLQRHEDADDRRCKRVRVTEEGRRVTRAVSEARLAGLQQFTQTLTPDECRTLGAALHTLLLAREDVAVCRPERTPVP